MKMETITKREREEKDTCSLLYLSDGNKVYLHFPKEWMIVAISQNWLCDQVIPVVPGTSHYTLLVNESIEILLNVSFFSHL